MNTKNLTSIHMRGLAVLAIATAFSQAPAGYAAGRHANLREFQATYQAPKMPQRILPAWSATCADVADIQSGEHGCSTGGPSGGLPDRN